MKSWRKRFQAWWMNYDSKPRGKDKRMVQKMTRSDIKKDTKKQIKDNDDKKDL